MRGVRGGRGGGRVWARGAAAVLTAASLAAAVTACGGEERRVRLEGGTFTARLPADQVRGVELATAAMKLLGSADSVRMDVAMTEGSAAAGTARHMEMTLRVDRRSNCKGSFDGGTGESGDLVMERGGPVYLRFTDESLDSLQAVAEAEDPGASAAIRERIALARGKYIVAPRERRDSLARVCDLSKYSREISRTDGEVAEGSVVRAESPTYRHGRQVVPVVDVREPSTVAYVAAEGKPHLVAYETEKGGDRMTLKLSDYDVPFEAEAPPASEIVDADDFGGPAGADLFEV